jgi:HK97 family phage portal protein
MSEERILSDVVWTPERGAGSPEIRSIAWNNFLTSDETTFFGRGSRTAADIRITPETALASTVLLACCRILAETLASLPINVMRRMANGGREVAHDLPLQKVLSFAPNEWQTKFEFFEQIVMTLTLWGNSYSRIRSGKYGAVSALDNLHPSRMQVERLENGRLRYSYTNPETGRLERYTQDQIMHVRWTAEPDGIKGMVPIEIAREAIALARACEIHAAKFWANNASPGIVLQTDGSLSADAAERLRDNWERLHRGVDRAHRTAVLTNGLKVEPVGFSAEQSQFESTRRFQSEEIARLYRIPLAMVQGQISGDLESVGQEFVTYTLLPWMRRIESAISRSLIYNDDVFYAEFDTKGLMRANSNSRAGFYSTMTGLGIYSINDCRRAEGLPPIENGDKHFVGMNQQPLEEAVKPKPDPMAAMMGGGAPPPAQGGVPSLPGVKKGEAPKPAEKGEASEKKQDAMPPEGAIVTWGDGRVGEVQHVMEQGTLDLKSGEKIEVSPGEPVALVVDSESGKEVGVKVAELRPAEPKAAVEEKRGFCPTGDGGGIDNSCGTEDGGSGESPPASRPAAKEYTPDVTRDSNKDGVTDAARVGVPAMDVPPPPGIGRLPGLDPVQAAVEDSFISFFEASPDKVSSQFRSLCVDQGDPPTFGTDDAKCLADVWSEDDPEQRATNRATLNVALHQAANAIAKRSFVDHLDTLSPGDEIMVTVGGCGAGKGFALKNVPEAQALKSKSKAVWDSAGDQNATENPWVLKEAESRGLKVTFVYVHADPKVQWADPNKGVVKRASDPKDGRMVDARVFADSYAIGAKNHDAFHQANKENPNARFVFLDNTSKPTLVDGVPKAALELDAAELAAFADREVEKSSAPDRVKAGATVGRRIWKKK